MARENCVMVIYPLCILVTSESNQISRSFPLKKKCTHTHIDTCMHTCKPTDTAYFKGSESPQ